MIEERYELAAGRIREMRTEETVRSPFREYFREMAGFVGMLDEVRTKIADGTYQEQGIQKLAEWNRRLYQDIRTRMRPAMPIRLMRYRSWEKDMDRS